MWGTRGFWFDLSGWVGIFGYPPYNAENAFWMGHLSGWDFCLPHLRGEMWGTRGFWFDLSGWVGIFGFSP